MKYNLNKLNPKVKTYVVGILITLIFLSIFLNIPVYYYKQYSIPLYRYLKVQLIVFNKHVLFKPNLNIPVIKDILSTTKKILDSQNIKFWLSEGTALGIYRNGELMLHDTDVDIEIDYIQQYDLLESIGLFIENGLEPWRITNNIISFYKEGEYIDIAVCIPDHYCVICKCNTNTIPDYDLKTIIFENEEYLIPGDDIYYEFLYGKNWRIPDK